MLVSCGIPLRSRKALQELGTSGLVIGFTALLVAGIALLRGPQEDIAEKLTTKETPLWQKYVFVDTPVGLSERSKRIAAGESSATEQALKFDSSTIDFKEDELPSLEVEREKAARAIDLFAIVGIPSVLLTIGFVYWRSLRRRRSGRHLRRRRRRSELRSFPGADPLPLNWHHRRP
jgi:hypothetical protein